METRTLITARGTPVFRLAKLRDIAEEHNLPDWRAAREHYSAPYDRLPKVGFYTAHTGERCAGATDPGDFGFRGLQDAHEVSRSIQHTGWYTMDDGEDGCSLVGIVVQIPAAPDGAERWLAGYRAVGFDGASLYLDETYDSAQDAAYRADDHARIVAEHSREDEREYRLRDDAETEHSDLTERIESIEDDYPDLASE